MIFNSASSSSQPSTVMSPATLMMANLASSLSGKVCVMTVLSPVTSAPSSSSASSSPSASRGPVGGTGGIGTSIFGTLTLTTFIRSFLPAQWTANWRATKAEIVMETTRTASSAQSQPRPRPPPTKGAAGAAGGR